MTCSACAHTDAHGWHGLEGSAHCHDCHHTWKSKRAAHCPTCCEQFTSYSTSDLHDGSNGCIDPNEIPELTWSTTYKAWTTVTDLQARFPLREAG
jgi:hypothetical protein